MPLTGPSATTSTMIWDDTGTYVTAVAVLNPSNTAATITITVRDTTGATIGTSALFLSAKTKTAVVLRTLPGLAGIVGKSGSVDFMATTGNVTVLGLRFIGYAFSSIPTTEK